MTQGDLVSFEAISCDVEMLELPAQFWGCLEFFTPMPKIYSIISPMKFATTWGPIPHFETHRFGAQRTERYFLSAF